MLIKLQLAADQWFHQIGKISVGTGHFPVSASGGRCSHAEGPACSAERGHTAGSGTHVLEEKPFFCISFETASSERDIQGKPGTQPTPGPAVPYGV